MIAFSLAAGTDEAAARETGEKNRSTGEQLVLLYPVQVESGTEDRATLEALGTTVRDTLAVTLQFMEDYRVEEAGKAGETSRAALGRRAEEAGAQNIIFGSIRGSAERIEVELSVYDRYEDEVSGPKAGSVASILDTFELADRLVVELVEDFSGMRVAYGQVRLMPEGAGGPYRVLIDRMEVGASIRTVEKLLVGEHRVEVVQERGEETITLADRELTVEEGKVYEVSFELPYLTGEEAGYFGGADRRIADRWIAGKSVTGTFSEVQRRAEEGAVLGLAGYERLAEKYGRWKAACDRYIGRSGSERPAGTEGGDFPTAAGLTGYRPGGRADFALVEAELLPAGPVWRSYRERHGQAPEVLSGLEQVDAGYRETGDAVLTFADINLDGSLDDFRDAGAVSGGRSSGAGASDVRLQEVYLAAGRENLYLGIDINRELRTNHLCEVVLEDGDASLELQLVQRQDEEGPIRWQAFVETAPTVDASVSTGNGEKAEFAMSGEAVEVAIPRAYVEAAEISGAVDTRITLKERFSSMVFEETGPLSLYIPEPEGASRIITGGLGRADGETGTQKGTGWMFPVTLGAFAQQFSTYPDTYNNTYFAAFLGAHYSWGSNLYWGFDAVVVPAIVDGPRIQPHLGLALSDQERVHTHLFSLMVLPMAVFDLIGLGGDGIFISPGYGYAYRQFTVNLVYPFWFVEGEFGAPGLYLGAGYSF
ncbi:MAG: hypothetical protein K9L68_12485 [Spirochaetales bacterium]|nr:hypothetical protein [Spirochaetales bacterium]